ncbi:hypothetical protein PVAND_003656 [Polypedilum vanderplanki]|uniref:Cytochrome P450 n=1 Tax=Polypedilum vanderplanki TaxID=319348 RepID=A0A9J6BVR7_POLVA|nr:hypothetical protein PVAND_003656 [Polypedilum vanderplanki]
MLLLVVLTIFIVLIAVFYFYISEKYKYFEKRGIVSPKYEFFFGHMRDTFFKRRHVSCIFEDMYQKYKNKEQVIGFFDITTPYLLIIDPELIKQVLIKDFKHFRNNEFSLLSDKKKDPVMALNPFVMRNEEWKQKRIEVATGMTQNKLRSMFPLVHDVSKRFVEYLNREIEKNAKRVFDARDISVKYTCDTVASCIFAIDGGSFTKKESEIINMGNKMIRSISDAAKSFFSKRLMPQDVQDFFVFLMEEAIKYRENNNISRDDFLAHIINLRRKKNMSDVELVAHGVTFFLDGFDTSSVALAPIFYELGRNPEPQQKLRQQLLAEFPNDDDINYDKLLEHPYLDQVVYESLRIHPPICFANRECSEEILLDTNKGKIFIEQGTKLFVPLLSIQHDNGFYHDPMNFIPERFDHGIKEYSDKGILIPFSQGPRMCLGMRFALLQLKCAIFEIVRNFEISVDTDKTPEHLEIDPSEFLMNGKKDTMWLKFKSVKT